MSDTDARSTLVVIVHGFSKTPGDMGGVSDAVKEIYPHAVVKIPPLPTRRFSFTDPNVLVVMVANVIDEANREREVPFERIILAGHSLGALVARKVFLVAAGELRDAPFEPELRKLLGVPDGELFGGYEWAKAIDRIVLLAAVNRGWRVSHHLTPLRGVIWSTGKFLASVFRLFTRRTTLIMRFHRGSEFVTNLRIQWIKRSNRGKLRPPLTIQLLGSRDDLVSPLDNIDLVSGSEFVYLDVPESTHGNIIEMSGDGHADERRKVFQRAIRLNKEDLDREAVIPSDDAATKPDPLVTDVVFVIHGIRDEGFWTHKIARKVRALGERDREEREKLGKPPRKWATETSSYGYFAMLPFLLPFKRRHKVEWMMDQYAEALARYPSATFHYVGHSHGTYLLAKALKLYPSCRFGRVVFAGSVVACGYEWNTAVNRRQVEHVLNFVATTDWVVAFFPKLFEFVPIQDLGSAGHDGFRPYPQNGITQFTFVRGGHSAAIKEELWNTIAEFVSAEKPVVQKPERALTSPRSWWVVALGWFPFAVWLGIVAVIGLIVYWINLGNHTPAEVWTAGASTVVFIFLVLFILRRV